MNHIQTSKRPKHEDLTNLIEPQRAIIVVLLYCVILHIYKMIAILC